MLGPDDSVMIQVLVRRGIYLCDIAQQLWVHTLTVRCALDHGGVANRGHLTARLPAA
jgi:hypothetical protein